MIGKNMFKMKYKSYIKNLNILVFTVQNFHNDYKYTLICGKAKL